MLDILIAANIALAAVILLTTIYMDRPLEFSVFLRCCWGRRSSDWS